MVFLTKGVFYPEAIPQKRLGCQGAGDTGSVRIDGNFKGTIIGGGMLVIGEGADVESDIHVDAVMISGEVHGQIDARKIIQIYSTGKVFGDLKTPSLPSRKGRIRGNLPYGVRWSRDPYPAFGGDNCR